MAEEKTPAENLAAITREVINNDIYWQWDVMTKVTTDILKAESLPSDTNAGKLANAFRDAIKGRSLTGLEVSDITDLTVSAGEINEAVSTSGKKADKVESAVEGDFAGLNAEGNLTDSGVKLADLMQKLEGSTEGNFMGIDADGYAVDSGMKSADFMQKLEGSTEGNFMGINADGYAVDSGKKAADFAEASHEHPLSEINDVTATATEVNYLSGVTSGIQGQLDDITSNYAKLTIISMPEANWEPSTDANGYEYYVQTVQGIDSLKTSSFLFVSGADLNFKYSVPEDGKMTFTVSKDVVTLSGSYPSKFPVIIVNPAAEQTEPSESPAAG